MIGKMIYCLCDKFEKEENNDFTGHNAFHSDSML